MQGETNTGSFSISTAQAPDLDWSQVSETVRMLNLAVAQIAMAMHEGEDSVESLTGSITAMVHNVDAIANVVQDATGQALGDDARGAVLSHCASVQSGIQQSIVAFQFYDRLSQRIDHVRFALEALAQLVADKNRLFNPYEWQGLQGTIRSKYSMQEEQDMFEALVKGATVEQALECIRERVQEGDIDDIELF